MIYTLGCIANGLRRVRSWTVTMRSALALLVIAGCGGETAAPPAADACAPTTTLACDDSRCALDPNVALLERSCFPEAPGYEYMCITSSSGFASVLCAPLDGGCGFAPPVPVDAGGCP